MGSNKRFHVSNLILPFDPVLYIILFATLLNLLKVLTDTIANKYRMVISEWSKGELDISGSSEARALHIKVMCTKSSAHMIGTCHYAKCQLLLLCSLHYVHYVHFVSFTPYMIQSAASLLLNTNVADDTELDVATAIKKLRFEIDECDRQMKSLARDHSNELVGNFHSAGATRDVVAGTLAPLVEAVRASYSRIDHDIVVPYKASIRRNDALKRLHGTLTLLRGATVFLSTAQHIGDCSENDIIRLSRLYYQMTTFYQNAPQSVLSLALVRNYKATFASNCSRLENSLSEAITADMAHHTSFSPSNEKLRTSLVALYSLNPESVFPLLERSTVAKSVQVSLTSLSRALQSPRAFSTAIIDARDSCNSFCANFLDILHRCIVAENDNLLRLFLLWKNVESVDVLYWDLLAHKFKKSIAATMARGGPIAKSLSTNSDNMMLSVHAELTGVGEALFVDVLATTTTKESSS